MRRRNNAASPHWYAQAVWPDSVVMRPQGVRTQGSSSGIGHLILLRADGRTEVTQPDGSTVLLETDLLDVAW